MQIFITGANGFIGGAVASALGSDGHAVRGLVRDMAKAEAVAAHGIEPVIGHLTTRHSCKPKLRRPMPSSMPRAAIIAAQSKR